MALWLSQSTKVIHLKSFSFELRAMKSEHYVQCSCNKNSSNFGFVVMIWDICVLQKRHSELGVKSFKRYAVTLDLSWFYGHDVDVMWLDSIWFDSGQLMHKNGCFFVEFRIPNKNDESLATKCFFSNFPFAI